MTPEQQLIDTALRTWKSTTTRLETHFHALSDEELEQQVAPGRNRLIYLLGHMASTNDALLPLLGIGPRLHPELDAIFVASPDRSVPVPIAGSALKEISRKIDAALLSAFSQWTPAEWLARHTAVSEEDFLREPHRNRLSVMLSRTVHMGYHYGQATLATPRG